jgi:hypothetical protein
MSKKKHSDSMKIPAEGERWDCPRCSLPMQRWKHAPEWKPEPGKSWFPFWFECLNKTCRTTLVMPKGVCVKPGEEPPPDDGGADDMFQSEEEQRLRYFRSI